MHSATPVLMTPDPVSAPYIGRVIRNLARDSLLLPRKNLHRFIDPEAPGLSIANRSGRSIVAASLGAFSWTGSGISLSVADAAFNGKTVFSLATTNEGWAMAPAALPLSYSFLTVLSVPQAQLDALAAGSINRTIFATGEPTEQPSAGPWFCLFAGSGGTLRGFQFYPRLTGASMSTDAASLPAANVPMTVGVRYNNVTKVGRIYLNNPSVPAATKSDFTGSPGNEATRYLTPASYQGTTTRGLIGKLAAMVWLDDTDPATATTDAEWAALMTAWNLYYRGV